MMLDIFLRRSDNVPFKSCMNRITFHLAERAKQPPADLQREFSPPYPRSPTREALSQSSSLRERETQSKRPAKTDSVPCIAPLEESCEDPLLRSIV